MNSGASAHSPSRLERLLGFLGSDPANPSLLADAAEAAFDDRKFDLAAELLTRYAAITPLPAALINLEGLIALAQERFADAATVFSALRAQGSDNPVLRFNLAWAHAMAGAWGEALETLDETALAASPRAPALKIRALHHLGRLEDALAEGETLAARYPDNQELMGALASLAMDAERSDLALHYAKLGSNSPEGRTALGMLVLGTHNAEQAGLLFDSAIAEQPGSGRAWIGKGLSLLIAGQAAAGAEAIDRGADLFEDHLGSWIASGWAHFAAGDSAGARQRFERALALDPNFSESQGALAVMDLLDGHIEEASRRCEIALRLDRKCFGGALAKVLLLQQAGQPQMAQRIRDVALNTPIGPGGETIVQAMAGFGMLRSR